MRSCRNGVRKRTGSVAAVTIPDDWPEMLFWPVISE